MSEKKTDQVGIYSKVKSIIKSLNLDQQTLASQLDVHQTMVSNALNGKNEKTFQRLIVLLEKNYDVNLGGVQRQLESENDIEAIKAELQNLQGKMDEVLKGIEELKGKLDKG